jgi:peptidyl-prolyl cis-trans isomerase D
MLEALRKNSKNAIIYVLFGVIIAVFIINFGPGSRGCEGAGGHNYAVKVAGDAVSETEFRLAYLALTNGGQIPPQFARERHLKEFVMNKLIERELLAQEAERLGFDVPESLVNKNIEEGRVYVLGIPRKWEEFFKDGVFDYERFKNVCQNRLGVTVAKFVEVQKRELLADQMRQLVLAGAKVPPDEVKQDYEQHETQVNVEFVRFAPHHYDETLTLAPAEIAAWQKGHDAELKKYYEEHSYLYKKVDKHAHLARIVVGVKKDAGDAEVAKAKAKIEEAAKRVKAGAPFAEVARQVSDDPRVRAHGGDLGWRKKGFSGLMGPIEEKAFAAKAGDLIGPDKTDRGFELVQVQGFREGDLPLEQVAPEIAEELMRQERSRAAAKAEAEAALAKLKAGQKLAELYPKLSDEGEADPLKRDASAPRVQESGLVPRSGDAPEVIRRGLAAKQGEIVGPIDSPAGVVLGVVKEKKDPDMAQFDKRKGELERQAEREKWGQLLEGWSHQKCVEVKDEGRIKVNDDVLAYEGVTKPGETKYEPCKTSRLF